MFIGHALLGFAVAALVARRLGRTPGTALAIGVVAGAFATLPDVDIAYGIAGFAAQVLAGAQPTPEAFWSTSDVAHRTATHSLVVGAIAAPAFGLLVVRAPGRVTAAGAVAIGLLGGLVGIGFLAGGALPAAVLALFALCGALIAWAVRRASTLSAGTVGLAALWGLWSHLFGDLVTGAPPTLLYPFDLGLLESRVLLHPDPTLHLLGAFAIELAAIWLALATCCRLTDRSWTDHVDRRAGLGAAYGVAALLLVPPTLEVSYHFVFSILGVGVVGGAALRLENAFAGIRAGVRGARSGFAGRSTRFGSSSNWFAVRRSRFGPRSGEFGSRSTGFQGDAGGFVDRSAISSRFPGATDDLFDVLVTGLATVTIALASYGAVYLAAGAV